MTVKSSLRERFLELLKKQGSQERQQKSRSIQAQLFALPAFAKARTVLFYASLPGEVDTLAMISQALQQKKIVALPVIERTQKTMTPTRITSLDDLTTGHYGIVAPHADAANAVLPQDIDAVIVPALAFDKSNNRLGRGVGYYDRFLADLPKTATTIGLAFDFQIVDRLPTESHDIPVDLVIAG